MEFPVIRKGALLISVIVFYCLMNPILGSEIPDQSAAQDLVVNELLKSDISNKRVLTHPGALPAGARILTWRKTAMTTPAEGFVVFIDDHPFANFEHPCRYVFVDKTTGEMEVFNQTTPPLEMTKWREMNSPAYRKLMNARNIRAPRSATPAAPRKTARGGEYYAVLMSGGANSSNNHVRYWNDLSNIYITLIDVYGYKDQNIIVLCSDGLDPSPDQSNGKNSDPDLDFDGDDDIMYPCVQTEIQSVFDQLKTILTIDDQLFIFTTDHGGSDGGWNVYLNLWNSGELKDSAFETMVDALPPCDIITTMEQCYSGGFLDNLQSNNRVFSSACLYTELSYAMGPNYEYDTYVFHWTAAVKGEDAYGKPVDADMNKDGLISMREAFVYAKANDNSNETPQYDSTPSTYGEDLLLGPGPAIILKFESPMPEGYQPPGLAHEFIFEIKDGLEIYKPGTAELYYRFAPIDPYTAVAATSLGGGRFTVSLPNTYPGVKPQFYFSAEGDLGTVVTSPNDAPSEFYSFDVVFYHTLFHDNFESNLGWTVENVALTDGQWERGLPIGGGDRGDPEFDKDGSGQCYLTDNEAGNSDVDGGPTRLISPAIDLSSGDATISYWRWFTNDDNDDIFSVEISNDNGATWNVVDTTKNSSDWNFVSFEVSTFVPPTNQIKMRFNAVDNPNNSVTEAGLDAFSVGRFDMNPTLWADAYSISVATGAKVSMTIDAGISNANRKYLILGSISGTQPGFKLPGGQMVPLNWDMFTTFLLESLSTPIFTDFLGKLDGTGKAVASFDSFGPIDPLFIGSKMDYAFVMGPPPKWDCVSNNITIVFEP